MTKVKRAEPISTAFEREMKQPFKRLFGCSYKELEETEPFSGFDHQRLNADTERNNSVEFTQTI